MGSLGNKSNENFSDVVRRVGGAPSSTGRGRFDIYVDQAEDTKVGEIVMMKKRLQGEDEGQKEFRVATFFGNSATLHH